MEAGTKTRRKRNIRAETKRTVLCLLLIVGVLFGCGFALGRCTAPESPVKADERHQTMCYGGRSEGAAAINSDEPQPVPWSLRLVNGTHRLNEGETPPQLSQLPNGQEVDARIREDLDAMLDGAKQTGLQPVICSAYRSHERQVQLFENKKRRLQEAGCPPDQLEERAAEWVARPGSSEHELGLAMDIVDVSYQALDDKQENTPTQQWLLEHSWEYGFVLRYPSDHAEVTGVEYEPWHYRYVGREAAEVMHREQLCLEEYLSTYYHVN